MEQQSEKKSFIKNLMLLHLLLLFNSIGGICSKLAGKQPLFSGKFVLFYGTMLFILFVYAFFWQQLIKQMPLTTAYSNKAVGLIWGIIWGVLLFHERLTFRMVLGALIVLAGVVLVVKADE